MQFKQEEKIGVELVGASPDGLETGSPDPNVGSSSEPLAVSNLGATTESLRQPKAGATPQGFGPPSPVPTPSKPSFMKKLRLIEINQMGVLSICAILSILATAVIMPNLDQEAKIDRVALQKQFALADAEAAKRGAEAVANQDAAAMASLGLDYLIGNRVTVDRAKSKSYFQQASKLGNADATLFYGLHLHSHQKAQHDASEALIQSAVDRGSIEALEYTLFRDLRKRFDRETIERLELTKDEARSLQKIRAHYKGLADAGDTEGIWGYLRLRRIDDSAYLNTLRKNATTGDLKARYVLGFRLTKRMWPQPWSVKWFGPLFNLAPYEPTKQSQAEFIEGMDWLKLAATAGYLPAQTALSSNYARTNSYMQSKGMPFFDPEAFAWETQQTRRLALSHAWQEKSGLQRGQLALLELSDKYYGRWPNKDTNAAIKYAQLAIINGDAGSIVNLGNIYCRADREEEAVDAWLAAMNTNRQSFSKDIDTLVLDDSCETYDALKAVTTHIRNGEGIKMDASLLRKCKLKLVLANKTISMDMDEPAGKPRSAEEDKELFSTLQKMGTPPAQYELGTMYLEGRGVPRSAQSGLRMLEVARISGNQDAALALGEIYFHGKYGVAVNHKLALKYYREAAIKQRDGTAMTRIAEMYQRGDSVQPDKEMAVYWYREAVRHNSPIAVARLRRLGETVGRKDGYYGD